MGASRPPAASIPSALLTGEASDERPRVRRGVRVLIAALVTLGSGVLNLWSVIGPSLPGRHALLRSIFPLEFLHLSRSVTLIIGFALIVSSINIYRRKRRAFQFAVLLVASSVVFHLTKGLDYEDAIFSGVFLALLWSARKNFTVRSSIPDWRAAAFRLAVASLVAVGYGIAGFWFLDPREFGINFTLADSIHRTVLFLSLVGDPQVVPHTRYAHWFVDSLYLMTATAILYSGFSLFRPVLYRFRIHPHEEALAREIVARHGRCALDYFKTWPDKSFFFSPDQQCFLAYRVGASFAVVLGDPVGPEDRIEGLVCDFLELCQENDWRIAFHQALPDFLPVYLRLGFKKLKIGDDALVDLKAFSLEGKGMKATRNAVTKLEKSGVRLLQCEPPLTDDVLAGLRDVSDEWLCIPGRRERQFTLGRFEPEYVRSTPVLIAASADGRYLGFVNIIKSFRKGEATIDLMRRRTEAPNGLMDYLFVKLFLVCKERGYELFNLGMAPMAGFREKEEASPQERAVHQFFQHLNFLFSFKGLRAYKAKFANLWEPRYAVYRNAMDLPRLAIALGKVSEIQP
ncbi:MAG TPA: phosphatidylglycerol lysyltransferase domain-containing protein [Bryobacteraceae bacterium]|nr:phosphatidylglycerol lysyltransferase domain-containing protein [Bryobacteraceae bacterium]